MGNETGKRISKEVQHKFILEYFKVNISKSSQYPKLKSHSLECDL